MPGQCHAVLDLDAVARRSFTHLLQPHLTQVQVRVQLLDVFCLDIQPILKREKTNLTIFDLDESPSENAIFSCSLSHELIGEREMRQIECPVSVWKQNQMFFSNEDPSVCTTGITDFFSQKMRLTPTCS